ncbi:33023_t:CDS:2, partial [Gigaspora margarita]
FNKIDQVKLKELAFSVNNNKFRITYEKNHQELQQLALINLGLLYENNNINSRIDINDQEIINEIIASIRKGAIRSIKNILLFIIPTLLQKNILSLSNSTIHIRISGDGKNSALSLLVAELKEIQSSFFYLAGNYWNVVFYLFADWKFLSICQGHKAANSKDYCL